MRSGLRLILLTVLLAGTLVAQQPADTLEYKVEKRVDLAFAETVASNVLLWAFNRYIREDNYSFYISWRSVETNLRHGFEWDPNQFKTNFIAHPYHGNIYFNAARTNGLNFWESIPFAFGGSMMWELTMESEFGSYNDLIMTTFGGIYLGESLFRFSEQVLDDRARGWERFWREFAGTALNPVGAFNRAIKGDMFRHSSRPGHLRFPINGYVALGGRGRVEGSDFGKAQFNPTFELTLHYGEPFKEVDKRKPFDYSTFRLWRSEGQTDSTKNLSVTGRAVILGKNVPGKNDQKHLPGLFADYDYYNLDLFKLGGFSLNGVWMSAFPLGKGFTLVTGPSLGVIILGAGSNEYVLSYQGRNYNFGQGYKAKLDMMLKHQKFGELFFDYGYFSIYSREGVPGVDHLNVLDATYTVRIWRSLGAGAEYTYYYRNANYDNDPDIKRKVTGVRALITLFF